MTVAVSWNLLIALILLIALGVVVAAVAKLGTSKDTLIASLRSILQLTLVSLIIVGAMAHVLASLAFVLLMFGVAVYTTGKRTGTLRCWPWISLAMAAGVVPVSVIIFCSGTMPFNGPAIIPVAGIIVGNMMTAHTLAGRRFFAELRSNRGTFEAALAIGLERREAIGMVIHPVIREPLVPSLDSTRTVGLVTLPGAFVGVLLGGGSPIAAGAAQLLVLIGIVAGQACTVVAAEWLMATGRDLPDDLKTGLQY